jgi:hypothetical protein
MLRCRALDTGAYAIPATVLAALPAPPRSLHLEASRDALLVVPTGGGAGVLVHAGYTVAMDGGDATGR